MMQHDDPWQHAQLRFDAVRVRVSPDVAAHAEQAQRLRRRQRRGVRVRRGRELPLCRGRVAGGSCQSTQIRMRLCRADLEGI